MYAHTKKKQYFKKLIEKSNSNPKALFNLVNKELDRKQGKHLPDFTEDMTELANQFNNFFIEKIDTIRSEIPPSMMYHTSQNNATQRFLTEFELTNINEIKEVLNEGGFKCSPADPLPSKLFKDHANILLPILVKLANCSLQETLMALNLLT